MLPTDTPNNTDKRLLSNGKSFSCALKVLLHLQRKNFEYFCKMKISRLQIILISICQNYQMASTVIMLSLKTH